jgi:hypothetical protein
VERRQYADGNTAAAATTATGSFIVIRISVIPAIATAANFFPFTPLLRVPCCNSSDVLNSFVVHYEPQLQDIVGSPLLMITVLQAKCDIFIGKD